MEEVKVFLIDLCFPSELSGTLQSIFESCEDLRIHLKEGNIGGCGSALFESLFNADILKFNPDIVLFVLSQDCLNETNALLQFMKEKSYEFPVIAVMEDGKAEDIIKLLKLGILDFIIPPIKAMNVLPRIWRLLRKRRSKEKCPQTVKDKIGLKQLLGKNPVFLAEMDKIAIVAESDVDVLILGETGTGKELCARAIHYLSPRRNKPFVPVSCGAIPTELVENELFGHVQGAFTGAGSSRGGLIQETDGGTLLLDEVDCLPLLAQAKLLRFLQEKEYKQLGSSKILGADIRVVASSNIDLEKAREEGKFRQDLYYRLNIIALVMPPLRERKEDIPLLASHFLERYSLKFQKEVRHFTPDALRKLLIYEWPGNVRELENAVERSVVFSRGISIEASEILLPSGKPMTSKESFKMAKARIVKEFETGYIEKILANNLGNITMAAREAGKDVRSLRELIRRHRIDAQAFKNG